MASECQAYIVANFCREPFDAVCSYSDKQGKTISIIDRLPASELRTLLIATRKSAGILLRSTRGYGGYDDPVGKAIKPVPASQDP